MLSAQIKTEVAIHLVRRHQVAVCSKGLATFSRTFRPWIDSVSSLPSSYLWIGCLRGETRWGAFHWLFAAFTLNRLASWIREFVFACWCNMYFCASSAYRTMPKLDRSLKGGLTSHCSWSGQRTAIPATNQWAAISAIDLIGSLSCIRAKEQCSIQPWCWWSCDGCFSMYTKNEQTCKPVFSCVMPFLESNILQGWKRVSWRCRSKLMLFSKLLNGHTATKVACSMQPYTALNSPCPWNVHLGHALPCSISRRGDCCNAYGTTSILPEIFGVIWRKLSQSDPKAVL